jgi:hypothetical protein
MRRARPSRSKPAPARCRRIVLDIAADIRVAEPTVHSIGFEWDGYRSRLRTEKAAGTWPASSAAGFGCPSAAKESPYRLTEVRLRPRRSVPSPAAVDESPHLTSVGDDVEELPDLGAHEYRACDERTARYGPRTQASIEKGEDPAY